MKTESQEIQLVEDDDNDITLKYVRDVQKQIVSQLMKDGQIPQDKTGMEALTQNLSNLSTTALAIKRLKKEDEESKSNSQMAEVIAELLKDPRSKNYDRVEESAGSNKNAKLTLKLNVDIKPGELDVGNSTVSFGSIMGDQPK